jgi:type III restriction enzyme
VWNDAFRVAARILSPDVARTYTEARARRNADEEFEDALVEAREEIAALGLLENLPVLYDAEAKKLSDDWFAKYREPIKELPDDRQEAYRQITALSREAQDVDLSRPVSRMEATAAREQNGTETKFPTYKQHLLCDKQGDYPVELDGWEKAILQVEMQRDGFKFWYRNPDRPTQDSLGVAYVEDDETKIVRPDFLFFAELPDGGIAVDIVDPHGFHLADALPKLQGLARYAETHPQIYRRIEAVAESGGRMRVLDLTSAEVRAAVMAASSAKSLYEGAAARDYA